MDIKKYIISKDSGAVFTTVDIARRFLIRKEEVEKHCLKLTKEGFLNKITIPVVDKSIRETWFLEGELKLEEFPEEHLREMLEIQDHEELDLSEYNIEARRGFRRN